MPLDGKNYEPCENARLLRKAAQIVDERGLCKFSQEDVEGRVCLHGAINIAKCGKINSDRETMNLAKIIAEYLRSQGYTQKDGVYFAGEKGSSGFYRADFWNNAPERTEEEVVAALRGAADFAESKVLA